MLTRFSSAQQRGVEMFSGGVIRNLVCVLVGR